MLRQYSEKQSISRMLEGKTFSFGHSTYLISKLNWVPLTFEDSKWPQQPKKRFQHTSTVVQGKMYIFGGSDNYDNLAEALMHVLDLSTLRWSYIELKPFYAGRSGMSAACLQNQIYFFGGSTYHVPQSNDFFKFNPRQNTWTLLEALDMLPTVRQLSLFVSINDEFLLLYGGIDLLEDKIYDDAHIFKKGHWQPLNITHNIESRIKMRVAQCGNRIFIFGGQGPSQNEQLLFDDLYQVFVDQFSFEMQFKLISKIGKWPGKRTSHGMCGISKQFFLIYGGQGQPFDAFSQTTPLHDIWIYDVEWQAWSEIETIYGNMKPRFEFTISGYKNQLFIFGGFENHNTLITDLTKLQFIKNTTFITESICNSCQEMVQQLETEKVTKPTGLFLSTGFYYNLALEIKFSFKAIDLIVDSAEMLGSSQIRFSSQKTKDDLDYFLFEFDTKETISSSNFLNMRQCIFNSFQSTIIYNIKVGGLRIGKTILYVCADGRYRKVFLLSANSKFSPGYEDAYIYYSYVENLQTGLIYPSVGHYQKLAIYNILKTQLQEPYQQLSKQQGHYIYIFETNIITTVENVYYYELIFYPLPDNDVRMYKNQKKTEFLEQIGINISDNAQFSLRKYFQISRISRSIKITLNNSSQYIGVRNYRDLLLQNEQLGKIKKIAINIFNQLIVKIQIYRCIIDCCLSFNQGILIYSGNYLVNRYDCKFGKLISDKFYRKKYKGKFEPFKYMGIIVIDQSLALNKQKTKFKNHNIFNSLMSEIRSQIKKSQKESSQTNLDVQNFLLTGNGQPLKKIKKD